ncbi:MAG: thioesterase domain-containing protein [Bacteroidota bacterium]|nr:thioesterase domain-containing protein [Bacteroidota bacterium]
MYFLKKNLPVNISCYFLEYKGRGARVKEDFAFDIWEVVEDLYFKIERLLQQPYALYGHSMGAKVAYLLAKRIQQENRPLPVHLFISGTDAPSIPNKKTIRYLLPKEEFITSIKEMGGLPDEVLQNQELLEYFEPILRADFKASESYVHKVALPLNIPITVLTGDQEDLEQDDVREWQNETTVPVKFHKFAGNHFFIFHHQKEIGEIIATALGFKTKA